MVSKTIQPCTIDISDGAQKFAHEKGLEHFLNRAINAVREVFSEAERISVAINQDEYGEEYVNVDVAIHDFPEEEAENYSACLEKWVSFMPPEILGQISLSTSWAR